MGGGGPAGKIRDASTGSSRWVTLFSKITIGSRTQPIQQSEAAKGLGSSAQILGLFLWTRTARNHDLVRPVHTLPIAGRNYRFLPRNRTFFERFWPFLEQNSLALQSFCPPCEKSKFKP